MGHTNEVQFVDNGGWDRRILVCRNRGLVDTYLIVTRRYVVVVDTMINATTAEQLLALARSHLGDGRSLLVVNSHADYDHCWGNQVFAALAVPIIGHCNSPSIFFEPDSMAFLQQVQAQEPEIFAGVIPTPPTILFAERLIIDGGDLTLELLATPGHTTDHTSLYIREISTLLAADGAELPYPMARTPEGLPHMRHSLARLLALGAQRVLYCHAPAEMGPQLLRDNLAYFERLESACRAALARGAPANPSPDIDPIALVGLPYANAVPDTEPWQRVPAYYATEGHRQQIRQMLAWLAGEEQGTAHTAHP